MRMSIFLKGKITLLEGGSKSTEAGSQDNGWLSLEVFRVFESSWKAEPEARGKVLADLLCGRCKLRAEKVEKEWKGSKERCETLGCSEWACWSLLPSESQRSSFSCLW